MFATCPFYRRFRVETQLLWAILLRSALRGNPPLHLSQRILLPRYGLGPHGYIIRAGHGRVKQDTLLLPALAPQHPAHDDVSTSPAGYEIVFVPFSGSAEAIDS